MRIVSLCPSNTELLFELGLQDQIVGVDDYSDYPEAAKKIEKIGDELNVDIKKIKALKPDLVVASMSVPGMEKTVQEIRRAKLNHIVLETERFTDFMADAYEIGCACGAAEKAAELAARWDARLREILSKTQEPPSRPAVYFEWWKEPYYAPGSQSWITDMIHMAGGENIFRDVEGGSKKVSDDEIIERNPEVILVCWVGEQTKLMSPQTPKEIAARKGWNEIDAVKNGRIITLSEPLFGRPGPRLMDGLELLIELFNNYFFSRFE